MSFRTGVLQSALECGTSGDAKASFLFSEQPSGGFSDFVDTVWPTLLVLQGCRRTSLPLLEIGH